MWIEDDPEFSVENTFGLQVFSDHQFEPIIDKSIDNSLLFERAYEIIDDQLERYDYIIIDINLEKSEINNNGKAKEIMKELRIKSKNDFLKKAGFDLFILLMEKGFPKERIIFFSANCGSSTGGLVNFLRDLQEAIDKSDNEEFGVAYDNLHKILGKDDQKKMEEAAKTNDLDIFIMEKQESLDLPKGDTFEDIKRQFNEARIQIPNGAISKNKPKKLEEWFNTRLNFVNSENEQRDSDDTKNYLTLRRGILNVIESLEDKDTKLSKRFEDQIDKSAFLEGLRWLLQSHKLDPKQAGKFYLILCDYMTKPFESLKYPELKRYPKFDPDKFPDRQTMIKSWIEDRSNMIPAKFMRNWIAHGLFTGSKKTPEFSAHDVCFTFLIVIKSIFDKEMTGNRGELKRLLGDLNIPLKSIRSQVVRFHKSNYDTPYISDNLDVIRDLGDKKQSSFTDDKWHWENQNYLFHFYASCLLASTHLRGNSSDDKHQKSDEKYTVNMTYELQQTSFIKIAYKRIQELSE
jgi:hypothetical protein